MGVAPHYTLFTLSTLLTLLKLFTLFHTVLLFQTLYYRLSVSPPRCIDVFRVYTGVMKVQEVTTPKGQKGYAGRSRVV